MVYGNGDVGMVGEACVSLAPMKWRKWALACAQVSCGGVVCVIGRGKEVSVGIVECTAGKMGHFERQRSQLDIQLCVWRQDPVTM